MRIGVVLDELAQRSWADISATAEEADCIGVDSLYLAEDGAGSDPFIAAASLAAVTSHVRVVAETSIRGHPVHLAEKIAVADNCLRGRLSVVLRHEDQRTLAEAAQIITAALRAKPLSFAGTQWTVPASLPANAGVAWDSIRVTPAPVQANLPVSVIGTYAADTAAQVGVPFVGQANQDERALMTQWHDLSAALGVGQRWMERSAKRVYAPSMDVPELTAQLTSERAAFGLEHVYLQRQGPWSKRDLHMVRRALWPRMQLDEIPLGLSDYWQQTLEM